MSSLGNKEIMAKNIRRYMSLYNVTQTEICNTLGIKMPTFSDWVNAKTKTFMKLYESVKEMFVKSRKTQ